MVTKNYVSIPVKPDTKTKLDKLAHKGTTYDQLMNEILKKLEVKND